METPKDQPAFTIPGFMKIANIGRAKTYDEINKGRLRAVKIGRATRILPRDAQAYLDALPAIVPKQVPAGPKAERLPAPSGRGNGQRRRRR